jgi:hypothetical protein
LPAIEAKARQYIHLGYQRLLGFEIAGGGFDWFGNPPANRTLSAYGLLELVDMAKVHNVDPEVISRTRQWLLGLQNADGSWHPEERMLHEDPSRRGDLHRLTSTAYIGWAVFSGQPAGEQSRRTLRFLRSHAPESIDDPYVLALVAMAVRTADPTGSSATTYLNRLESLKRTSGDGKLAWWELAAGGKTAFYGGGPSGNVEATAMAALALIQSGQHPETCRGALAWLIEQKDARGIWPSTQATVLALKALLAGTSNPLGPPAPRHVEIAVDGQTVERVTIPADEFDVVRAIDVTAHVGAGAHRVSVSNRGDTSAGCQVVASYYSPQVQNPASQQALAIELAYDRTELVEGDRLGATATIVNHLPQSAPMVILDLPIPPGFAADSETFDKLVAARAIAKYQLTPRSVIVYLRSLDPETPLKLEYRLAATMPVRVTADAPSAYEYYNPAIRCSAATTQLTVRPR